MKEKKPWMERHKKKISIAALAVAVLFFLAVTVFLGKPLLSLFEDPEIFRDWVKERGWGARGIFVGMMLLQMTVALIPGEPLEIGAGLAFGAVEGTVLCMAGIAIGSSLVFFVVRRFGVKLVEVFFPLEKIHSLRLLQDSHRFDMLLFFLMLIPGTPKDLISYFVGLTPMKYQKWLCISVLGRIPSVLTSTLGGNALGTENYLFAAVVFVISALISFLGICLYERITKKRKEKAEIKS